MNSELKHIPVKYPDIWNTINTPISLPYSYQPVPDNILDHDLNYDFKLESSVVARKAAKEKEHEKYKQDLENLKNQKSEEKAGEIEESSEEPNASTNQLSEINYSDFEEEIGPPGPFDVPSDLDDISQLFDAIRVSSENDKKPIPFTCAIRPSTVLPSLHHQPIKPIQAPPPLPPQIKNDPLKQTIINMGFSPSLVDIALQVHSSSTDTQTIVEYILLLEKYQASVKSTSTDVYRIIQEYIIPLNKDFEYGCGYLRDFLVLHGELGFDKSKVGEAMEKFGGDKEKALEFLM